MTAGRYFQEIGSVLKLEYGKPLPQADRNQEGQFAAYGANGVKCRTDRALCDERGIIVGRKGSAGEVTLTDGPFWPLDVTYYVTFDESRHDLLYLFYCLKSLNLPRLANGVKPGINRNAVYELKAWFPPLGEQKRIVAILDAAFEGIDTAIANAEQNLANARALFEIIRNSAFAHGDETWTETTLGAIADFKNGLNFTKHSAGTQVGIVGVKDFQSNFFVPTDNLAVVRIDGSLSDDYRLRSGDILTVRSNGNKELIGRCLLARDVPDGTSHSGFTIRIRVRCHNVEPAYLTHYLKTGTVRAMLVGSGGGTNISSLNQTSLKQLPVAYPTRGAQQRMIERLDLVYERTEALTATLRAKLEALSALKQSVLSKAFTGRLTDLPESALDAAAEVAAE